MFVIWVATAFVFMLLTWPLSATLSRRVTHIRRRSSMGRRGPAPTPTKVKMLRGETRPSRLTLHEPLPSPDVPEIPADMDAEAKIVVPSLTVGYVWHAGVQSGEVAEGLTRIGFEIVARCVCHRASG